MRSLRLKKRQEEAYRKRQKLWYTIRNRAVKTIKKNLGKFHDELKLCTKYIQDHSGGGELRFYQQGKREHNELIFILPYHIRVRLPKLK